MLHLSQSSVVRSVFALEQTLGCPLFERSSLGMNPTLAGAKVALRAHRAFTYLAQGNLPPTGSVADNTLGWLENRVASGVTARHLKVLSCLAETSSETTAARELDISQSAVHQTLVQLEYFAGAPLFLRMRKGLRLTEAGDAMLLACKLARAELAQAVDDIAAQQGVVKGRLVIGTLPFSTGHLLAQAVDPLLRAHPHVEITIIDGTYDVLLKQLRHAEIEIMVGALRQMPQLPELEQEVLFLDSLAVVARASHPLATKPDLSWQDLRSADWIMPMPDTPAQAAFAQALLEAGIPMPTGKLRVNSALMMHAMLAQSDRLALMSPRQVHREISAGLLAELGVKVGHEPRKIGLVRRKNYLPTPAAGYLLEALRHAAQCVGQGHADL